MNDWASVQWEPVKDLPSLAHPVKMKRLKAHIPWLTKQGIGVDPGVNFGICFISEGGYVDVLYGSLPKIDVKPLRWRYGIGSYQLMLELLSDGLWAGCPSVVEGAAYHAEFGQVGLAEVRFGFALGLEHAGTAVAISPPAHIRSVVMGKADHGEHVGMFGYWPTMNTNAADAVGVAAYASGYKDRLR